MFKKIQIYALLSVLIFYLFFIQRIFAQAPATPDPSTYNFADILINEVSFKNKEHDWIELFVTKSGTLKGLKVFDDSNFIKVDRDITVNKDDYILIYFKADDELIGYNEDILIIQDTKSGLTGTTEQVVLKNAEDNIVDFVCWRNSKPTSSEIEELNELEIKIETCIDSEKVSYSDSIARDNENWIISNSPTPGEFNNIKKTSELPEIDIPEFNSTEKIEEENEIKITENFDQKICSKDILISEILPNPIGRDTGKEWIELKNSGSEKCSLEGWYIDDDIKGSSSYYFKKNSEIIPDGYFLIPSWESKINLNNNEDKVRLFKKNDELMDEIYYENAKEDKSFSKIDNEFLWTEKITPLTENLYIEKDNDETADDDKKEKVTIPNGDLSDFIQITEIMPNPEGTDKGNEWIELYNNSETAVNLNNWLLDSGENTKTEFIFQNFLLAPYEHLLIKQSSFKFSLKNSNGEVRLLDFNKKIIDQVDYEKAEQAKSYSKMAIINKDETEYIWNWTDKLTPGGQNPEKNKLTGEVLLFDETNSVLSLKIKDSKDAVDLNVLNDGISNYKNVFLKGTKISALTSENKNGKKILDEFEVLETKNINRENNNSLDFLYYLIPSLIIVTGIVIVLLKKYKILKITAS